ncbi:MAG: tRNA epoxyqueuosine(34) reductase QueG [Verrucomicrobiota bacterium]|jgi:epoxyqueuosine reductase|nr:tRNA epoxyqueuosine(34) reductase QueG [Verrucomicrobiota bacterium]
MQKAPSSDLEQSIREAAAALGFDACGFTHAQAPETWEDYTSWLAEGKHGKMEYLERHAEKKGNLNKLFDGTSSVISLAVSYHADHGGSLTSEDVSQQGVIARYARHEDYHEVLKPALQALCDRITAIAGPGYRHRAFLDTGPIMERDLAQRAGMGFIGKHTNLISRSLGNWFFIAEILTTLELKPDSPEPNRCGTCERCMHACPTDAIPEPFRLDARKCISYLTIELKGSIPEAMRSQIGNRIFGCDDCLTVCPWNRFAREGRLMQQVQRSDLQTPELMDLLAMDQAAFKQKFANTPIMRTKRRGLLRNVCVALGNVGDTRALPLLQKRAADVEPLIAEHAQWAIRRIRTKSSKREDA